MKLKSAIVLLILVLAQTAYTEPWGPWSNNPQAPVISSGEDREPKQKNADQQSHSIAATPFLWLLTFYQKVINPISAGRCQMYPTCSQYCVQAVRKHGPAMGVIMTADRLMHEGSEQDHVPYIKVGTRYRFDDPVQNNDFWWYGK